MTTSLEAMERLINDADAKFEEKMKHVQAGHNTNLSAFADRTYNLRQQVAHNAALTNDDHFMELLLNTEKFLSLEYIVRGEIDKKLTALLAGLLKTLLRETVAMTSYAARKIQIEMIWQWYKDKDGQILEFMLKKQFEGENLFGENSAGSRGSMDEGSGSKEEKVLRGATHESPKSPTSRRDGGVIDRPSGTGAYAPAKFGTAPLHRAPKPLTFEVEAQHEKDRHLISKKMGLYRKRNLSRAEKLRSEVAQKQTGGASTEPRIVYTKEARDAAKAKVGQRPNTTGGSRSGISGPHPLLHRGSTPATAKDPEIARLDAAVAQSQKHYVKRMIQRVEEENDKKEMEDMLTTLSFNQARIEEESSRRLESEQFASQAGRTCHTILRREARTFDAQGNPSDPVTSQSCLPSAPLSREETLSMLNRVVHQGSEVSLSPYDAYQPTPLDERKIQALLSKVNAAPSNSGIFSEKKMKPTYPRSLAGTPARNVSLDVTSTDATVISPAVPRTDVPLIEQLLPVLREEEDVPSLSRMEQLRLVDRIRECLGRATTKGGKGFHVPRSEIEKAILTPDDRPYDECFKLLPRPSSAFPKNPFNVGQEKGKKGKGGKKKTK